MAPFVGVARTIGLTVTVAAALHRLGCLAAGVLLVVV
jgi:hypothetical protein